MLTAGSRLGPYEIVAPIGAGGMGEVYRGRDTRLGRDVAIKVLPAEFAAEPERVARFEREAKVLASLNHPNIAVLYGVELVGSQLALAMELVEGEGLDERIARGPMPIDEAVPVARQIAEALEAAHERGIVHRDLKPANVKVRLDGTVKVLDFGLAKAWEEPAPSPDLAHSPTVTGHYTREGVVLGTAAYMSPEQARGKPVDKRADIWAFGCLVYEMLTGRKAFGGETVSDVLAAVLAREPKWSALPATVPPPVTRLLRRCLDRDPRRRLHDIADARLELEDARAGETEPVASAAPRRTWSTVAVALGAALLGLGVAWLLHPSVSRPPIRCIEFPVENLEAEFWNSPLISPDGARLAWIQGQVLRIRRLDDLTTVDVDMVPAAGSEGSGPAFRTFFWSADGAHLAFAAAKRLWSVSASGGAPLPVCDIPDSGVMLGGDWGSDDVIVFSAWRGSLYQVPAAGGRPEVLMNRDPAKEVDFHQPRLLPEGRGLLFTPHWREQGYHSMEVLVRGERHVALKEKGFSFTHAAVAPGGFLLFDNENEEGIWAVRFPLSELRPAGKPFSVVRDGTHPSISRDGTLVYVRGAVASEGQLVWVTYEGSVASTVGPIARGLAWPALGPDGRRIVASVWENNRYGLWVYDMERGTWGRCTTAAGQSAVWSPSGDRLLYVETDNITWTLRSVSPVGGGGERTLLRSSHFLMSGIASPDGSRLIYVTDEGGGGVGRIWSVPVDEHLQPRGAAEPLGDAPVRSETRIAPQGDLIAYAAIREDQSEVFIHSFPSSDSEWRVSGGRGASARWSRTGDRLFFLAGDDLMEVEVRRTPSVALGAPRKLFSLKERRLDASAEFDVDAQGRFLMVRDAGEPMKIVVAINGARLLERGGRGPAP